MPSIEQDPRASAKPADLATTPTAARRATRRRLSFAFLWAFAILVTVHALDFPGSVQDFKNTTHGQELLDTNPSFDPEAIHAGIENYGDAGRANYRFRLVTVDVLLPVSLTPFLFLWMLQAVDGVAFGPIARRLLLSSTFVYLLFDLAENATLYALLADHPSRHATFEMLLPYLTALKRAGILAGLLVPAGLLALAELRVRLRRPAVLR